MFNKLGLLLILTVILAVACGPKIIAPSTPQGVKVSLALYFDRGLEGQTPEKQDQLNELGKWMEKDLIRTYKEAGYGIYKIESPGQYRAKPGHYLLTVKTVSFCPGSEAARMFLNTGAGLTLDIQYELTSDGGDQLLAKKHGRASTRTWEHLAHQLNQDILMEITPVLGGTVEL